MRILEQDAASRGALFLLLCVMISARSDTSARAESPQEPSTAKSATPKVKGVSIPKDRSLADAEYIGRGLPAHDRLWSGQDLTKASKVLEEIAQQDPGQLPRYQSKHSGATFARLTSAQNLEFYRDRGLPLSVRFPQALSYLQSENVILKLYLSAAVKKATGDSELVELIGMQLRTTVVLIELVEELLPTIRKDDPNYAVRMGGLKTMKQGLGTMAAGALQTLTERDSYRATERVRLVEYMKETFPRIIPELPDGSRAEILLHLKNMSKDAGLKDLQPDLGDLYELARKSVDRAESVKKAP